MDVGFDMNTNFTAAKSRSHIFIMLDQVGMGKYVDKLMQKGVDFHTFNNMTREDLRMVGITNHNDQDLLLGITKPMSLMYRELQSKPPKWNKIAANILDQCQNLAGSLVSLRRSMEEIPAINSLIDDETPASQAIIQFLKLIDSRIDLISSDMEELKKRHAPEMKACVMPLYKKIFIGGTVLAGTAIAVLVLLPRLRLNMRL